MTRTTVLGGLAASGLLLWGAAALSEESAVPKHMRAHLAHATAARDALVSGNLPAARDPLRWIAEHRRVEGLPSGWWPHVDQFNQRAAPALGSTDPAVLARAVAGVAQVCGDCHTQTGASPQLADREVDPIEGGVSAHMEEHLWAIDRMWAGLIIPDDAAWAEGAAVLVSPPMHHDPDIRLSAEATALAESVHTLGAQAAAAAKPEQKVEAFGQLLATCASCHIKAGARPDLKR